MKKHQLQFEPEFVPREFKIYQITHQELNMLGRGITISIMWSLFTLFVGISSTTYITLLLSPTPANQYAEYASEGLFGITLLFLILSLFQTYKRNNIINQIKKNNKRQGFTVEKSSWKDNKL